MRRAALVFLACGAVLFLLSALPPKDLEVLAAAGVLFLGACACALLALAEPRP